MSNGRLFAIDHGQALPSVQGITGKSLPYPCDSHLGWAIVQDQPGLLDEPIAALRRLSNEAIDDAVQVVPAEWWTAAVRAGAVRRALKLRRDTLPAPLELVRKRLR